MNSDQPVLLKHLIGGIFAVIGSIGLPTLAGIINVKNDIAKLEVQTFELQKNRDNNTHLFMDYGPEIIQRLSKLEAKQDINYQITNDRLLKLERKIEMYDQNINEFYKLNKNVNRP
jgi:hypothetical protein